MFLQYLNLSRGIKGFLWKRERSRKEEALLVKKRLRSKNCPGPTFLYKPFIHVQGHVKAKQGLKAKTLIQNAFSAQFLHIRPKLQPCSLIH